MMGWEALQRSLPRPRRTGNMGMQRLPGHGSFLMESFLAVPFLMDSFLTRILFGSVEKRWGNFLN